MRAVERMYTVCQKTSMADPHVDLRAGPLPSLSRGRLTGTWTCRQAGIQPG
jgi:hypothetical protein